MRFAIILMMFSLVIAGCTSPGNPAGGAQTQGSVKFQNCFTQCSPGNAGNGTYCKDGCRVQEASDTNSTYWCDQLDNRANIPECYGTVAKSSNDRSICNRLSNPTDMNLCIAVFGSPSTS